MAGRKATEFRTAFGTYRSESVVGQGGTGTAYAARSEQGEAVVVKVLDPAKATTERLKRFKNEYLFGFRNQHPNLVRVIDFGLVADRGKEAPFYVMPRYEQSLRNLLQKGIDRGQVLAVFSHLLSGVEAAHMLKVIHRDLKPENVLANGVTEIVVADFGIARFEEEELYTAVETKHDQRLANFLYAAPEQKKRGGLVDHRADIFALGLILNELFTGEVPQGADYRAVRSVAPEFSWVDDVVAKSIQFDAQRRPGSVAALRELLRLHSDQFEAQQRLDSLAKTVVPTSAIDDPLAIEPPQVVGVDYDGRDLIISLDRDVTPGWLNAIKNMRGFSFVLGARPENFRFQGRQARVGARDNHAQDIIDRFKMWLPVATARYGEIKAAEHRQDEERRRGALHQEREELERRERVRKSLTF
jgi:serine/threonine protein kinase